MTGGSASALSLSRPAQALLALRPVELLSRPRRPLSRGFGPDCAQQSRSSATGLIDNYPVEPSSTGDSRRQGARPLTDKCPTTERKKSIKSSRLCNCGGAHDRIKTASAEIKVTHFQLDEFDLDATSLGGEPSALQHLG